MVKNSHKVYLYFKCYQWGLNRSGKELFCTIGITNTSNPLSQFRHRFKYLFTIVHFTVVCLVAKPLNRNEAKGDLVMIQTLLLFKCKLLCYHANWILVSITTRSPSASLQIKGLTTKYTVKWPITTYCKDQQFGKHHGRIKER